MTITNKYMTDEQAIEWINSNAPADLRWWLHKRQQQALASAPCLPRPRPEYFGYEEMDGYGEHGAGGWSFEGGEEAYDAALAAWEKDKSSAGCPPLVNSTENP